jgi:hypothetical protein
MNLYNCFNIAEKEDCLVLLNTNIINIITKQLNSNKEEVQLQALLYFGEIISKGLINLLGKEREVVTKKLEIHLIIKKIMIIRSVTGNKELKIIASAILLRLCGTHALSDNMVEDLYLIKKYLLSVDDVNVNEIGEYSFISKQKLHYLMLYFSLTSFCTIFRESVNLNHFKEHQKDLINPVCYCW